MSEHTQTTEPAGRTVEEHSRRRDEIWSFVTTSWPVLSSFLFLAGTIVLAGYLGSDTAGAVRTPPCDCDAPSVHTREWQVWIATVSAGLAVAIVLALHGIFRLARIPGRWPDRAKVGWWTVGLYAGAALIWVLMLGRAVKELVHDPRSWPFDMEWRLEFVPTVGLLCAIPWLALTWLCHKAVHPYRISRHALRETVQDANKSSRSLTDTNDDIAALQQIWSQIVAIALALAVLVAVSLIPTGALRNLWLSKDVKGATDEETKAIMKRLEESFTTTDVLLYGAMWALVAAVVVIPLVASWRASAQSVIDAAYPPDTTTATNTVALTTRQSLESMLNLSSGILRNPLTVLTVATPLVTAALAAFVPEIGS
jgi:hypothetical protein